MRRGLISLIGGLAGFASLAYNIYIQSRPADLSIFAHGIVDYNAPDGKTCSISNLEIIVIPITVINRGGKTGIISQLDLTVLDASDEKKSRQFVASAIGSWRPTKFRCEAQEDLSSFSPIAIKGGDVVRESIIFYSRRGPKRIIDSNGSYEFTMSSLQIKSNFFGQFSPEGGWIDLPRSRMLVGEFSADQASSSLVGLYREDFFIKPKSVQLRTN